MPTTRPDTAFVNGECSACVNYRNRANIDWDQRKSELIRILETAPKNGSGYDCICASSGGKDSHYIALELIKLGARPLVVTATTCMLTEIGRKNIDNLSRYATTVEITPNRTVRAKLNKLGLQMVGDISWPEHVSIFSIPFRAARDFGIPTIFYGESPQDAYGGPIGSEQARTMTRRWISEFGGHLGLRPGDMVGLEGITERDMADYQLPTNSELVSISAYFLGQFLPWDSHRNAKIATEAGMVCQLPCEASWWEAENQDNAQTGLHDFFGWLKYGYSRLCAQISVDIRYGLISREEAYKIVRDLDGLFPSVYMGISAGRILDHIGMTLDEFRHTVDKFTNAELFAGPRGSFRLTLKEFADCRSAAA